MGLAIGIGNGILFTSQRGVSSIVPGLLADLCARATYCENNTCTTNTLEEIEAIRYTAPVLPVGLLADYPGAAAAYSLRNLIDTTTSVVRVRRSNDNAEQDFTAEEVTDGTLTTFTGANDGFVTIWYDQSGNSNNAAQATAVNQPKIVSSGVVELKNEKPCIDFLSTLTRLDAARISALDSGNSFSNLAVSSNNILNNISAIWSNTANDSKRVTMFNDTDTDRIAIIKTNVNNFNLYSSQVRNTNDVKLITLFSTGTQISGFDNGENGTQNLSYSGLYSNDILTIGCQFQNNSPLNGTIQEIIIYPSDQSSNRAGIETNINTEYSIY